MWTKGDKVAKGTSRKKKKPKTKQLLAITISHTPMKSVWNILHSIIPKSLVGERNDGSDREELSENWQRPQKQKGRGSNFYTPVLCENSEHLRTVEKVIVLQYCVLSSNVPRSKVISGEIGVMCCRIVALDSRNHLFDPCLSKHFLL